MTNIIQPAAGPRREGAAGADEPIPPGDYLLALVWFQRRASKKDGRNYLRCLFRVIGGRSEGQTFFAAWGLDTSKAGTRKRWELLLEATGAKNAVDLDSDEAIRSAFMQRAFKARVKVEEFGGKRQNDLEWLVYPSAYTPQDRAAIAAWDSKAKDRGWQNRDPGEREQDHQGDSDGEPQWSPGGDMKRGGEDDIPF